MSSIGEGAFQECRSLTSIVVDGQNKTYDSRDNCNAIIEKSSNALIAGCKNTILPNNITSIGEYAFYFIKGLTSITIPNSVTSIGEHAFHGCDLTSITIPNSVTTIGKDAFLSCINLTSVVIPHTLIDKLPNGIFWYCPNLEAITVRYPDGREEQTSIKSEWR